MTEIRRDKNDSKKKYDTYGYDKGKRRPLTAAQSLFDLNLSKVKNSPDKDSNSPRGSISERHMTRNRSASTSVGADPPNLDKIHGSVIEGRKSSSPRVFGTVREKLSRSSTSKGTLRRLQKTNSSIDAPLSARDRPRSTAMERDDMKRSLRSEARKKKEESKETKKKEREQKKLLKKDEKTKKKDEKQRAKDFSKTGTPKDTPGKAQLSTSNSAQDFKAQLERIEKRKSLGGTDAYTNMIKTLRPSSPRVQEEEVKHERVATLIKQTTLENDNIDAFKKAGKAPGLEIWRIEKMIPVRWPKKKYGKFYSGDSYICLWTEFQGRSRALCYNLFYWIGRKAPKDSLSSAAFRAVQLNDKLGGGATHHRETQGHESPKFMEILKYNIKYLKGGTESALNHVTEEKYETRLLQVMVVKLKATVKMAEPNCSSLNEEDCFILDDGIKIWVWVGNKAGVVKKSKTTEIANIINSENKGKGDVKILSGPTRDNNDQFWTLLGGKTTIAEKAAVAQSAEFEESLILYKVTKDGDDFDTEPIDDFPLVKDLLQSNNSYILDCGNELFAWVGKMSDLDTKNSALVMAEDFLTLFKRPAWTPITRLTEGFESVMFKSKFSNWVDIHPTQDFRDLELHKGRVAPAQEQPEIEMSIFHQKIQTEDYVPTEDEGSGVLEVWRMDENSCAAALSEEEFGLFSSTKSFIALYSYTKNEHVKSIAYFWEGRDANPKDYMSYEAGFYEVLVAKMEDDGGKPPHKIRYKQYAEGAFFMSLFQGMAILAGDELGETCLFDIRGTGQNDVRAVEVPVSASKLNSAQTYLLVTPKQIFAWYGIGANKCTRDMAPRLAAKRFGGRSLVQLVEGKESQQFWDAIGGKKDYANAKYLQSGVPEGYPRLLKFSLGTGVVTVDEIPHYIQADLEENAVVVLDAFYVLYVWKGTDAGQKLIDMANIKTKEYLAGDTKRGSTSSIQVCVSGSEPLLFKSLFHEWLDLPRRVVSVLDKVDQVRDEKIKNIENERKTPATPLMAEFFSKVNEKLGIDENDEGAIKSPKSNGLST